MARVKKIASQDEGEEEERIDSPIKPVQSSSDDSDSDSDDSADSEDKTQEPPMPSAFIIKTRDDVDTATTSKRKLTTTDTTTTAKKPVQSSSDDSDSDSDSDDSADSEDKTQAMTSAFTIKTKDDVDTAATSKRKLTTTDTTTTAKKSKTQAMTSAFTIKTKDDVDTTVATSKRKLTTTDTTTTAAKKSKKSAAAGTSNNTKQPQRIWTDDYEISLLKGMVEYKKDKGTEPSGNLFFDFIKNYLTLNFELSKNQLSDKIYRLRKKYEANFEKAGYGEPVFDKPHDQNVFKLSKKIWSREAAFDYPTAKKMTRAKGKVSETKKETKNPLGAAVDYPPTKAKKDKVKGKRKAKGDTDAVDGNNVGEEVKENNWSEMFLGSLVNMSKELEFPGFWDRFIKKRILKGDEMAKLLQENELELKLKKNEIQRKQLELAQFRASQS